ncbi:shikimate kinase [Candidatus Nitrospira allomarina]|uniref:Shikimate kinase n=1 Tax=Candidatus Nitrospira allomarina TaxID=3020900 RepID=A0AA96GFU6_9BACT|nr:shikimate kinase [Candidatus Nitrospira allomarina]WNM59315.1 shikimate kinase [Candidatus Nitrospira allomarina]
MNIVFIGYRGTGKSTVATILGQRLGRRVISTDEEIVKEAKQTIPQLIEHFGWDHFRGLETQMCQKLTGQDNLVIDTGGGLILKEENVKMLKENGKIFWLTAEVSTIASRISGDTQRPSLSGTKTFVEEIEEILEIRKPHYQAAADHVIPTDQISPDQIADAILSHIST